MRSPAAGPLKFAIAAFAVAVLLAACGSFSGSSGNTQPQTDAAADATSSTEEAGISGDGATCPVIYVDGNGTSGADTNDGCATNRAVHSISYAISRATAASATEIHVCAGTFDEAPITLGVPISLLGSYQCGSFAPPAEADGGTGNTFAPTTTLSDPASAAATLVVTGALVTASTRVDGFVINGAIPASATEPSVAMNVTESAAPTLSNLVIAGGSGLGTQGSGSTGVLIDNAAAPILTQVNISGGSGTAGSGGVGSSGIFASNAGLFSITSSIIDGGKGTSPTNGSVGVYVFRSTPPSDSGNIVIDDSSLSGGQGTGVTIASAAILTYADPRLKVTRNRITGGAGQCLGPLNTSAPCIVVGVYSASASAIEVFRNAIYAGSAASALLGTTGDGVLFINPPSTTPSSPLIHENMIVAGGADTAIGARFVSANGVQFVGNTIVSGTGTTSFGVELAGVTGAVIENNLLSVVHPIRLIATAQVPACMTGLTIDNNALLTASGSRTIELAGCSEFGGATINDTTLDELTASVPQAIGNVRVATAADCAGDNTCTNPFACTSDAACYEALFAAATLDETTLFSSGIALSPITPCVVARGGLMLASEPLDYYGAMRALPYTIGAEQFTSACTSN